MPNINDLMGKPKFRAWNKDILKQLKIEKPFKKEENPAEIEQKSDENVEEKTDTKVIPNCLQTDTKVISNCYQSDHRTDTTIDTKLIPNCYQSDTKTGYFSLLGLQKKIVIFIYNLCKISRDKKTDAISISQIANNCVSTVKSTKMAINRLIQKRILVRESFKNGRGGWTVYLIPNNVYQEMLTDTKLIPNWYQTDSKVTTELTTEVIPTPLSSSSININNITTTTERDVVKEIGEEYKNIDSSSLEKIGFGFTQISQLFEKNIDPNLIQESINHFAFALENNEKIKQNENPLNLFMGVLRKGRRWVESNYEPVQTIELRALLELKKKEKEEYEAILAKLFELEYNTWFTDMTDEELKKLLPNADFKYGRHIHEIEQQAKILFKNTKWIKILNQIKKAIPNQL